MELVRNEEKRAEYTKRAKELVSKMTLEEKVQQTLYQALCSDCRREGTGWTL